jgi:CO/xanthine dehydrogenase Mo-binding subunit
MSALPAMLADNPRLDLWVNFAAPGQVTISTGRVEIGQGVLTAMAQVAAEELDVAVERLSIRSGETDLTPNEGYTVGSQSMQMGGVALRQACADARGLFLDRGAQLLGRAEGGIDRPGRPHSMRRQTHRARLLVARSIGGFGNRRDWNCAAQIRRRPRHGATRSAGKGVRTAGLHP